MNNMTRLYQLESTARQLKAASNHFFNEVIESNLSNKTSYPSMTFEFEEENDFLAIQFKGRSFLMEAAPKVDENGVVSALITLCENNVPPEEIRYSSSQIKLGLDARIEMDGNQCAIAEAVATLLVEHFS